MYVGMYVCTVQSTYLLLMVNYLVNGDFILSIQEGIILGQLTSAATTCLEMLNKMTNQGQHWR